MTPFFSFFILSCIFPVICLTCSSSHSLLLSRAAIPPVFTNCPKTDVTFVLEKETSVATINVAEIIAMNASGLIIPVWIEQAPEGLEFDMDLVVSFEEEYRKGVEVVYYTEDLNKAKSTCKFKIKLVGKLTR